MPVYPPVTQYDDNGFPAVATEVVPLTFAGGEIKPGPGRLMKVQVTTALAGSGGQLAFYDTPFTSQVAGATPLFTLLTAAGVLGASFTIDLPAVAGLTAVNTGGTLTGGAVSVGIS